MDKPYYECHVTIMGDPTVVRPVVENSRWTFSAIDGDPVLGDGIKCYATRQINYERFTFEEVCDAVLRVGDSFRRNNLTVIREKVELVMFDRRSKIIG